MIAHFKIEQILIFESIKHLKRKMNFKLTNDQYIKKVNHLKGKSILGFRIRAKFNVNDDVKSFMMQLLMIY